MEIIKEIEAELITLGRMLKIVQDETCTKEIKILSIKKLIDLWTKQLERLYLEQNLNSQKVEHDSEELSDYYEREGMEYGRD